MNKTNRGMNYFFLVLIIIIAVNSIFHHLKYQNLDKDFRIGYCIIQDYGYRVGSAGAPGDYSYTVNNVKYIGHLSRDKFCINPDGKKELRKIHIPIVYENNNHSNSMILLKKSDYEKYNVNYPDSISHLLLEYFECDKKWWQ